MSEAMLQRGMGLIDHHQAAGLLDAFEDGVGVQRRGGAQVDDLAVDAGLLQLGGGLLGLLHHAADGHDGHVVAFADHGGFAEGHGVELSSGTSPSMV
jgi:hypothetical protein